MQDACHTASNRLASIGTRISWTPVVENEHLFLNLNFLKFWHHCDPCPGPRGRATHWIKLGTTSKETKKPVYRDAPFSLLIKFSQIKNIYTFQGKIFWLKFAWNGIQTFIADVSVKQPFSRQFAITMRQIKINLKRKFGFHEITSMYLKPKIKTE